MNELFQEEKINDSTDNTTGQDEHCSFSDEIVEKNATTGNYETNVLKRGNSTNGDPRIWADSNDVVNAKCGCLIS